MVLGTIMPGGVKGRSGINGFGEGGIGGRVIPTGGVMGFSEGEEGIVRDAGAGIGG